jgi:hypothetical protein
VLITWAGTSGAVGNLSEVGFAGVGLLVAIVVAAFAGYLVAGAFRLVDDDPGRGALDVWAAYFIGLSLFILLLTLVPVIQMEILPDENRPISDRLMLIELVWIVGHVVAASAGALAGRWFLRRGEQRRDRQAATV